MYYGEMIWLWRRQWQLRCAELSLPPDASAITVDTGFDCAGHRSGEIPRERPQRPVEHAGASSTVRVQHTIILSGD